MSTRAKIWQNLGCLPLTSEQTCWNASMLCSFVNSTTAPPSTPSSARCLLCVVQHGASQGSCRETVLEKRHRVPCQSRQAKEMPPTEGESGPIGQHPPVCNSLSVFGTTRAWLNQVFEAWRRPGSLSCQSIEGIPPQGMRKNRLALIWPFPLGWQHRNRWHQISTVIHHGYSTGPILLHLWHWWGIQRQTLEFPLKLQLKKERWDPQDQVVHVKF